MKDEIFESENDSISFEENTFSRIKETLSEISRQISKIPEKISRIPWKITKSRSDALIAKLDTGLNSDDMTNLYKFVKQNSKLNIDIKYKVFSLIEFANNEYPRVGSNQNKINKIMEGLSDFLTEPSNYDTEALLSQCKELDSQNCPHWLKVIIGIVLAIIAFALLLSAIALALSLTGGILGAAIALAAKPLIDIVAGITIASMTVGTTAATVAIGGAGVIGAVTTGVLSCCFFMHRPYTNRVEEIIKSLPVPEKNPGI